MSETTRKLLKAKATIVNLAKYKHILGRNLINARYSIERWPHFIFMCNVSYQLKADMIVRMA